MAKYHLVPAAAGFRFHIKHDIFSLITFTEAPCFYTLQFVLMEAQLM